MNEEKKFDTEDEYTLETNDIQEKIIKWINSDIMNITFYIINHNYDEKYVYLNNKTNLYYIIIIIS